MANVFIHGRSPTDKQISCRVDETGVLLTTTDIKGENGETLIINEPSLTEPPSIGGSINALNFGLDTINNDYHPISIDANGNLNVNIVSGGGGGGGGGLVQIQGYNGSYWENITTTDNSVNTNITNESIDTNITNSSINTNITNESIDTNITNQISNYSLETTQQDIKTKTDNLTFNNNSGVLELNVFDIQNYGKLDSIETYTSKLNNLTYTDNKLNVNIDNTATNYSLENNGNLEAVKINTDKLKFNGDDLKTVISNTGFNVNNQITNFSTEPKQDIQIEELEKVVDKKGDIEAVIYYNEGSTIWADSTPTPAEYEANPNGWVYTNAEAGNAMNLYYFNGTNETKTLSQCVGQYAVVSNLSTKLNNKMIFGIYTKGSPFYTTRITHSPANGVDMVAGGKYLLYWGSVDADIYPNLPRLNFTNVVISGSGLPTEEILSVSLNTDSSTPAGDLIIFVESLGVVFSDGSVNESRILNLLSTKTEYVLTADNTEYNRLSYIYLTNLNKTNGGLDVYIKNDNITISNTTFDIGNFPTNQNVFITNNEYTPIPITGSVGISGNVNVNVSNTTPISITGTVDINSLPAVNINSLPTVDINTLPSVDISNEFTLNTTTEATNTKLDTIHNDLDGLTYDGFSNLNVNVASGTLTVDSVKIKASNGDDLTATSLGDDKSGLDTASNMFGYAEGITRTAITCDSAGKMNVNSNTKDYLGNGITSTTTSISGGNTNSLDTASSLYVSNGSTRTALTSTGSSLNTNITNTVPISGTVAFSNTSIEISNLPTTQSVSGTVAISNTSINSRIYGSSNGNDWHHVLTTPQGKILNNSSTQDGNGTGITSTLNGDKQSLDVNIANSSVPISGTINIRATNGDSISTSTGGDLKTQSRVFTDIGNATGTDITSTRIALDTASSLYTADGTTRNNLTSTAISSIRALDVNVANTVAFSNTSIGISGTASVADSTGNGYLNTINQGVGYAYIEGTPVPNATIAGNTIGTYGTWTRGQYRKTVFNYSDGNTANTDSISIYSRETPSNNGVMIATFYPYVVASSRQYSGVLELGAFNSIAVRNNSSSSISGVSLKLFSS